MKRLPLALLGLSLLANAGLVVALRWQAPRPAALPVPTPAAPSIAPPQPSPTPEPTHPPPWWQATYTDDWRVLAGRLKEAGVPVSVGRSILRDLQRSEYLAKQRQLIGAADPASFWQSAAAAADRDKQAVLRRLSREQQDMLNDLYGRDEQEETRIENLRMVHGPLPADKLVRVDRIHEDYDRMAEDIRARAGGVPGAADLEALALLEQERRKDIAALLGPDEVEMHELAHSGMARALRARMADFVPTEAEFRVLFRLLRAGDERSLSGAGFEERLRVVLGERRYAEYLRTQEPGYKLTAQIAERCGLPSQRAAQVAALSGEALSRLRQLRDDPSLPADAVRRAMVELAGESNERLRALLGQNGAELYKRTSAGAWLCALDRVQAEPLATPTPSAAPSALASPSPAPGPGQSSLPSSPQPSKQPGASAAPAPSPGG